MKLKALGSVETSAPGLHDMKMKTLGSFETSEPGLLEPEDEHSSNHRNVGTRTA